MRSDWRATGKATDFYDLKGTVEDLLAELRLHKHAFRPVDVPPFVPGTSAELSIADKVVGYAGQVDPQVVAIDRLPFPLFAFELDLETLLEQHSTSAAYHQLSRQPSVTRDLAIVVPMTVAFADIEATGARPRGRRSNPCDWSTFTAGRRCPKSIRAWRCGWCSAIRNAR